MLRSTTPINVQDLVQQASGKCQLWGAIALDSSAVVIDTQRVSLNDAHHRRLWSRGGTG